MPRPPSRRALADARITEILAGIYEPDARGRRKPESLYGSLKMWEHLNRQGIPVARCTVERLMARQPMAGSHPRPHGAHHDPDPAHSRAPDLVKRDFKAERPGQLHVADFTYVPLDGGGFGYTAFVIDAFAGLIAGWECSLSKQTAFVEKAIRQAAALRARQGHPISGAAIHHSDAGSQGGFNWSSQHLDLEVLRHGVGKRQQAIRAMRGQMWSPGRPSTARREDRVRFWEAIARGLSSEDAAVGRVCRRPVGSRWFRQAGGMPPISLAPLSGRYLSFAEREEIAILHAQQQGVREIARRVGRSPSTISRELRRNASTRSHGWSIGRRPRSGMPSGVPAGPRSPSSPRTTALREYVQDRLAGHDQHARR